MGTAESKPEEAGKTPSPAPPKPIPEWTVLYHGPGKLKGRGEFLRLVLEDAGITTYRNTDEGMYGPAGVMDCFRGSSEAVDAKDDSAFPLFFPPALWHRPPKKSNPAATEPQDEEDNPADTNKFKQPEEVLINQVGACMVYLGETLGYAPVSSAERARADCIMHNALDYLTEGRNSFHPIRDKKYLDQKEEADASSKEFSQGRLKLWLHHFQKVVKRFSVPQAPVAGGKSITYADFALFHVLDATVAQFNNEKYDFVWDNTPVVALKEYYEWMKERPNLQAYFASNRCAPWAGDSMM